jgi:hypothetical protein
MHCAAQFFVALPFFYSCSDPFMVVLILGFSVSFWAVWIPLHPNIGSPSGAEMGYDADRSVQASDMSDGDSDVPYYLAFLSETDGREMQVHSEQWRAT